VLFPTLPDQPAPQVTVLPDGAGVKVEVPGRIDWIFLPEQRASLTADGIEFSGIAGSYSQRGAVGHYMIERRTHLSAQGLGVTCNFPVDLMVSGNIIKGRCNALDAVPVLTLTGPVAQRARAVTIASAATKSLTFADGGVQISLPLGDTTFEIGLQ
jgi:hypothetical protein